MGRTGSRVMRRSLPSRFSVIAAFLATLTASIELAPPRRAFVSSDFIPCHALPDPDFTEGWAVLLEGGTQWVVTDLPNECI